MRRLAPPIALYCPAFARVLDLMEDTNVAVDNDIERATAELMRQASGIYAQEADRAESLDKYINKVLGVQFLGTRTRGATPDGVVHQQVVLPDGRACMLPIVIREDKNERGCGGCDPDVQAALSLQVLWLQVSYVPDFCRSEVMLVQEVYDDIRDCSCIPTLLLAFDGPNLTISAAILTDKWIVQPLSDPINISVNTSHYEKKCARLSRVMYALREGIKELGHWYQDLSHQRPAQELDALHPRFFPERKTYDVAEGPVSFTYLRALGGSSRGATFEARTIAGSRIVVKFAERYGKSAHIAMAEAGYAPNLIFCGPVWPNAPTRGLMIVMEFVEGVTVARTRKLSEASRGSLREALCSMHARGYVHGDFRGPNIIVGSDGTVKVIDFDWAGEDGKVFYPPLLSEDITWHSDVQFMAAIRKEHDQFMLNQILSRGRCVVSNTLRSDRNITDWFVLCSSITDVRS